MLLIHTILTIQANNFMNAFCCIFLFQLKDISLTPYVWEQEIVQFEHNPDFPDDAPEFPNDVPYMLEQADHPATLDGAHSTPVIVDHSQINVAQFNDAACTIDNVPSAPVSVAPPHDASIQSTVSSIFFCVLCLLFSFYVSIVLVFLFLPCFLFFFLF